MSPLFEQSTAPKQGSFADALGLPANDDENTIEHVLIAGHLLTPEEAARRMIEAAEDRDDAYTFSSEL